MLAIAGIMTASTLIASIEVPSLRKGYKKELWVFSVFLLSAVDLAENTAEGSVRHD